MCAVVRGCAHSTLLLLHDVMRGAVHFFLGHIERFLHLFGGVAHEFGVTVLAEALLDENAPD